MKRSLHAFIVLWLLLMAAVPLHNLMQRGPSEVLQQAQSGRGLSGLREAFFNLDQLSQLWAKVVQPLGISTDPRQVVIGRDGWLYLGDQYVATLTATRTGLTERDAQQAHGISESMMEWNAWLSRQGVSAFRIMIGPNKDSVHPEGLPGWATPRQPAKVHALATSAAGALYVDLRDGLRQQAMLETEPLYYRTDTHWNALGAVHALRIFAASLDNVNLGLSWPTDDGIQIVRIDSRRGGDLARFLRMQDSLLDREPVIDLPLVRPLDTAVVDIDTNELVRSGGNAEVSYPKQSVLVSSPQALNQRRVLWVRDSFGSALSPYMAATFREVVQLHYDKALADDGERLAEIVRQWKPDFVFITVVERQALLKVFLARPPGN